MIDRVCDINTKNENILKFVYYSGSVLLWQPLFIAIKSLIKARRFHSLSRKIDEMIVNEAVLFYDIDVRRSTVVGVGDRSSSKAK